MDGLYKKAMMVRNDSSSGGADPQDEFALDESSGISKDEQKEILTEINHLVTENKIKVSPEVFQIKPLKRGFLFPLLVNVVSLIVLAGGILTLTLLFKRGEGMIMEGSGALSSAEGKLLQELKRESEEQILEKNQQISRIRSQLNELDRERQELESNMNARIDEREKELRTALEQELAAERERLQREGISEEDIQTRLAALEAEKTTEYGRRLEQFKQQAEAERLRMERSLEQLESEYQQALSEANDERQRLLAESKRREEELRSELERTTEALRREKTETEQQLRRLSELKEKEGIAEAQLIEFYNTVRTSIRSGELDKALSTLESVEGYLREAGVSDLPAIQKRREVEMFFVDSLTRLVENEMQKEQVDTQGLIASANIIGQMKDKVLRADALVDRGEPEQAEQLYTEALQLLPEIARSHRYILSRQQMEEQRRRETLDAFLARAEAAYQRKAYEESMSDYARALEYLPKPPDAVERIVDRIGGAGFELGAARMEQEQSEPAASTLKTAEEHYRSGEYNEAIGAYIGLVNRYPRSRQVGDALDGIRRAVAARSEELGTSSTELQVLLDQRLEQIRSLREQNAEKDQRIRELEDGLAQLREVREQEKKTGEERIGELEASVAALRQELTESEERLEQLSAETARLESRIASGGREGAEGPVSTTDPEATARLERLQRALESRETELSAVSRERDRLRRENAALQQEISALEQRVASLTDRQGGGSSGPAAGNVSQGELAELAEAEQRLRSITSKYLAYTRREDSVLSREGEEGRIETKLYLDEFLTHPQTESAFPGFYKRIKEYDRAFGQDGHDAALKDVIDIVYDLSSVIGDDRRADLLEQAISRNAESPLKLELLRELKGLIAN